MDLVEAKNRKEGNVARHPWELARFEVINSLLKGTLKNEEGFNVLDIGCGDIFFVSKLSDLYPHVSFYAIDTAFTDEMISEMKNKVGSRKIYLFKTLEEAQLHLKGTAGLVLLLDVVEHIGEDKAFLKHLHSSRSVDANTRIMITVPAYQSLFCSHDRFLGHFRRYTNKTLLSTIESAGFRKVKMGYFFFSLVPPRVMQVWKEKLSRGEKEDTTGLVEWNKGSLITGLIKNILIFDHKVTRFIKRVSGIDLPGLSNYIICAKPA
jgi:hypothetical protein